MSARGTYDDYLYEPESSMRDDLFERANDKRYFAQGLGVAGAIAGGAAAYLWFTGRSATTDRVAVRPFADTSAGGFVVRGGF